MPKDSFVRLITAGQPEAPAYFGYDAALNRRRRPVLADTLARKLSPLSLEELLRAAEEGAQILDVRDPEYASGHLAGSVHIGRGGRFATWSGILLTRDRPIVLVAGLGTEPEAAMRLGRIGFDNVRGYLRGGIEAARERPDLVRRTERITSAPLEERLEQSPLAVVDVRFEREWQQGAIPGSLNVPLDTLRQRLDEIPSGPVDSRDVE